jgi:hypothetical protein
LYHGISKFFTLAEDLSATDMGVDGRRRILDVGDCVSDGAISSEQGRFRHSNHTVGLNSPSKRLLHRVVPRRRSIWPPIADSPAGSSLVLAR